MAMTLALVASLAVAAPPNTAEQAMERMRVGDALLHLDDMKGACEAYRETIELLPTWWMPHLALVRCGRFVGLPIEELVEHARFAARARPRIPVTHMHLGLVLEESGDEDGAIRAYEAALRAHEGMFDARYRLGILLAKAGKPKRARRHLERVLEARPDHVVARRHLASMYERLGMVRKAEAAWVNLAQRSRNPALALSRLVRFYQRHGMKAAARQARARYSARFPSAPPKK